MGGVELPAGDFPSRSHHVPPWPKVSVPTKGEGAWPPFQASSGSAGASEASVHMVAVVGAAGGVAARDKARRAGEAAGVELSGAVRADRAVELQRARLSRGAMRAVQHAVVHHHGEAVGVAQASRAGSQDRVAVHRPSKPSARAVTGTSSISTTVTLRMIPPHLIAE